MIKKLIVMLFVWHPVLLFAQDAKEIVRKAEERLRGKSSQGEMTIEVIRPGWKREMSLKTWAKGNSYTMVLLTRPAKDQGTVFLKRNKEIYNWMPSVERSIKLPPSMMSQSWMGTDFTNDDMVRESSLVNDYTHRLLGDSLINGRSCYQIELSPLPDAPVVWGKVRLWIDKKDFLQLKSEFYDEDGVLVNTMIGSDIRMLGGRLMPARLEMIPADKKGHRTVMTYQNMVFDVALEESFFTVQNMKRLK